MDERKQMFLNVGLFLKARREARDLTQTEVADILKVKSQFVSNWEHGRSMPPLRLLKVVMKLYNIPDDELVGFVMAEQEKFLRKQLKITKKRV